MGHRESIGKISGAQDCVLHRSQFMDVTMHDVKCIAALCLEVTAIHINATDGPVRFAEVALRVGLKPGFGVDLLAPCWVGLRRRGPLGRVVREDDP